LYIQRSERFSNLGLYSVPLENYATCKLQNVISKLSSLGAHVGAADMRQIVSSPPRVRLVQQKWQKDRSVCPTTKRKKEWTLGRSCCWCWAFWSCRRSSTQRCTRASSAASPAATATDPNRPLAVRTDSSARKCRSHFLVSLCQVASYLINSSKEAETHCQKC